MSRAAGTFFMSSTITPNVGENCTSLLGKINGMVLLPSGFKAAPSEIRNAAFASLRLKVNWGIPKL